MTVTNGMTYLWQGDRPLKIGDRVVVEGNWQTRFEPIDTKVKSLESAYEGPLRRVKRKKSRWTR